MQGNRDTLAFQTAELKCIKYSTHARCSCDYMSAVLVANLSNLAHLANKLRYAIEVQGTLNTPVFVKS